MDPLSVAGSIAGLVTLADALFRGVYKYYKTASDASEEIKELGNRLQSLAGTLHSLGILADALEQDGTHPTIRMTLISDAVKLLGEIQARLDKSKLKMSSSKLGMIQQSLKWPFTKTGTKELTEKLAQQQDAMSLALHADSLGSLARLLGDNKDIKAQLSSIEQGVKNLQTLTRIDVDAGRQRILDFFLKVNPQAHLDTSMKLRHPGTALWLIESPKLQQWIETAGSTIWLSGIPGAGKTVLAGAVIQKALERGKGSPGIGVAFFFCDYKDPEAVILSNILGAIASQLARQNSQSFDILKELFESLHPQNALAKSPDSDILQDCLEKIFKCFDQIILIVDGLDECGDNTDEVTQALADIVDYSPNVTMALASRDEYNIAVKLRDSFTKIYVGARKEDILLYVASEIDRRVKDGRLRITNAELKGEIISKLSGEAEGMFRWVTCQLDYICGCPTDADRRVALRELPPTLDATYERILRRINQGHPRARQIAQICFRLIAAKLAGRLHIDDMRYLVSIPRTLNTILGDHDIVTEAEIALQCSSFIRKSEDGSYFEFSHFTVLEFLERLTLLSDHELADYHVSERTCNATLAQQCLRLLQLRNFDYKSDLDKDVQVQHMVKRNQDLFVYPLAATIWLPALRRAPRDVDSLELAKSLLHPRKTPSFISWAVQLVTNSASQDPSNPDALLQATSLVLSPTFRTIHLSAVLDLPELCEHLIQVDPKWNTVSALGTPLECSIMRICCLHILSARPVADMIQFRKIRIAAEYATHRPGDVTTLLRMAGSIIQSPPRKIGGCSLLVCATFAALISLDFSPVSNVISMGWSVSDDEAISFEASMAQLLLNYPHKYVSGPHTHQDRLTASLLSLINSLNNFRVFDNDPGYKLCVAAWNTAVALECSFTEDSNLMSLRVTTSVEALIRKCEAAIWNDDAELMQRYLEDGRISGPETDDDGGEACGYSLLRKAVSHGSTEITKLLINYGYSVQKPSPSGLFIIHEAWACERDIIKLLLDSGASHLDRDISGNSIWHLAAKGFEYGTISTLLQVTGDKKIQALQMQNYEGYTPLTLAIQASIGALEPDRISATETINLLLDACERDALCWKCAGSPWHLVAQSSSVRVVKSLAESDVPVDPIQEGQSNPLHALGAEVSKEVVELLMKLFATTKDLQYRGLAPLEGFIYRCLEQHALPNPGVIESMVHNDVSANMTQKHSSLWEYFCGSILGCTTLRNEITQKPRDQCLDFIFRQILQMKTIEAYEELKGQSATIPLFSGLMRHGITHTIPTDILGEIIRRTKLWASACLAQETVAYVKHLISMVNIKAETAWLDDPIQLKLIRLLLSNGVNVFMRGDSFSILEEACWRLHCGQNHPTNGQLAASGYSLEKQVFAEIIKHATCEELNAAYLHEDGYLHIIANKGCHFGSSWMIEKLVAGGLDPNGLRVGRIGEPPLVLCLMRRATPAALSLLKLGADPTERAHGRAFNALHAAACRGQIDFLRSLLDKVQIRFPWDQQADSIMNFEGHKLNICSTNALHLASRGGHTHCIRFLIDNGVFLDAKSTAQWGYNCLHFAAMGGFIETIEYLHSVGLDINQPADDGSLPLHFAVRNGHDDAVRTLVKLGSAAPPDGFGMTPRMYAEKLKYTDIIVYLEGMQSHPRIHLARQIIEAQRKSPKALLVALEKAIKDGELETCERLIIRGTPLDVSMPSCAGCSPLITAILWRRVDIVSWLLGKHVSVLRTACRRHGRGRSTLELAVEHLQLPHILQQILDIALDTAWDLDSLGFPIYYSVRSNNHASLVLMLQHVSQNLERYRAFSLEICNRPSSRTC
ncbi:hypothetical protein F4803DRAFT_193342 [Xylaria telfairii]|nr:hypothetical protein F4803DRAFT_193342 [Xylaria telfairii]